MLVNRLPLSPTTVDEMAKAVAQVGPWVKFTVAKSSGKSCWVRSPQKTTVVAGLKSERKVTIVTTTVLSGTVVSSTRLTNPVTLNTGLPDRSVPWKRPPPQPSKQMRSTAKIRLMARLLRNQLYRITTSYGAAGSANLTPRSWFSLTVAGTSKSAIRISFVQEPLVQ
jgi:hypothetical protein